MAAGRRFEATETTTYRDLTATMRRLSATSLRVPRDILDTKAKAAEIVFDRGGRRYTVKCGKWGSWLDNFRAAERTIYYLYHALENYGALASTAGLDETFQQFFAGFEALPDDSLLMLTDGSAAWHTVLGIEPTATRADIQNAWRALVRLHHPDVGGDPETFKRVRRAYEAAIAARTA